MLSLALVGSLKHGLVDRGVFLGIVLHVQISDNYAIIYTSYELSTFNNFTTSTGTHISHYWYLPLNKYACHIVTISATALLL